MISANLTMAVAQAKIDDLRRAADAHRAVHLRPDPERPAGAKRTSPRFGSPPLPEPDAR